MYNRIGVLYDVITVAMALPIGAKHMTKSYDVEIDRWQAMSVGFPKEWEAFDAARNALVKAIRAKHGEKAQVSFKTYNYGIPAGQNGAAVTPKMLQEIDPALLAKLASIFSQHAAANTTPAARKIVRRK